MPLWSPTNSTTNLKVIILNSTLLTPSRPLKGKRKKLKMLEEGRSKESKQWLGNLPTYGISTSDFISYFAQIKKRRYQINWTSPRLWDQGLLADKMNVLLLHFEQKLSFLFIFSFSFLPFQSAIYLLLQLFLLNCWKISNMRIFSPFSLFSLDEIEQKQGVFL